MRYRVIRRFADSKDNYYVYGVGDSFPRTGKLVGEERISELASDKNALNAPIIEAIEEQVVVEEKPVVEEQPKQKKTGGRKTKE